ncbi:MULTISPECIES: IclR family transcriptional regulator C-terminal domain-containing protein [unclassified Streptomyces]|uniref:IclR family transcriptional regulator domain-containing protein n=1 Tax=unclassified Streptomyces TaxID=2593676 RepID=UPI0038271A82
MSDDKAFRSTEDALAAVASGLPWKKPDRAASRARLLHYAALLSRASFAVLGPRDAAADCAGVETAEAVHGDETLLDADEAAHELEALCAAVVLRPVAGSLLATFAEHAAADPEGAFVFACVLHLADDPEGAVFWWQLAAGAEMDAAVYCLFLDHSRRGEYHDAVLWARRLTDAEGLHAFAADSPLPPPELRHVLARSHRWTLPQEHEDLGTVPLASPRLAKEVFALAARTREPAAGSWMVPGPAARTPRFRTSEPGRAGGEGTANRPSGPAEGHLDEGRAALPGGSTAFSIGPLRHTTLTALAQQTSAAPHAPAQWEAALRVLDVLHAVRAARRPLAAPEIASAVRLDGIDLTELTRWLCRHKLLDRLPDGSYTVGPLFSALPAGDPVLRHDALTQLLDELRDATGAAIYFSRYTDGEIEIQHCSHSPTTPAITQWVDLKEAAHASANGKSIMAQLDFDSRMDHLARHRPYALTDRTITDPATLFRSLDDHGPHASQFDVLEYSRREVCVAVPVALDNQPACIALSLPAGRLPRLVEAARTLSERSGLILLTLLAMLPAAPEPDPQETGEGDAPSSKTPEDQPSTTSTAPGRSPSGLILPPGLLTPGTADWTGFLTGTR